MKQPSGNAEWLPKPVAFAALGLVAVGCGAHAVVGFQGAYLTYAGGVWLSLAHDLAAHGVLYRDLVSELGYGGTRYFPFFFVAIASLLKAGFPPAAAGLSVGAASVAVLWVGAFRVVRAVRTPALTAAVFASAAAFPYFVWQAAFDVRADVMAAGLNLFGVGLLLPAMTTASPRSFSLWPPALAFSLAFATKVTAVALPAAAVVALIVSGRWRVAARIAVAVGLGVGSVLALTQLASSGRAFRVWAAVMFAGSDPAGTFSGTLTGAYLSGLFNSHLVVAALVAAAGGLLAGVVTGARTQTGSASVPILIPAVLWAGSGATLGVTLSSPGTVPANHVIEWLAVSMVVLPLVASGRSVIRPAAGLIAAAFVVWIAAQNVARAREARPSVAAEERAAREVLVNRLRAVDGPILAESALWPMLAGRNVVLPDAFAARIVFREHPNIEARLVGQIERTEFGAIVLEFDPASAEGRGMYANAHFGPRVIAAVEAHYRADNQVRFDRRVLLLPRRDPNAFDTPRVY